MFHTLAFANHANVPSLLRYKGQPIDPLCLYENNQQNAPIDLEHCGLHATSGREEKGNNATLITQGYMGYNYVWHMKGHAYSEGFSYYKPLGVVNNKAIVQTLNNSGGTGLFSSISIVTRNNNKISVRSLAEGDRCNQGIVDAAITKQNIHYTVNITPYDFFLLGQGKGSSALEKSLPSCASCCIATATFKQMINDKHKSKPHLLAVNLNPLNPAQPIATPDTKDKHVACLEAQLIHYQQQEQRHFSNKALKSLVREMKEKCKINL